MFFGGHKCFLWSHWFPCFGLLVTSPLGFKARVGSLTCGCYTFPEIHLWCYTNWPLGGQHGSWAVTYLQAGWWSLKTGSIVSPLLHSVRPGRRSTDWVMPARLRWYTKTRFIVSLLTNHLSFKVRRCDHFGCRWRVPLLPPATKLGQGYIFTGVCDSVNGGGGLPQCMLGYHPSGTDTPPAQNMLGDTVNVRAVRILLECNLILFCVHHSFIQVYSFTRSSWPQNKGFCKFTQEWPTSSQVWSFPFKTSYYRSHTS